MSRLVSRLPATLASSDFFLFTLLVIMCMWLTLHFFLPVGITELRDQRIHYSLPFVFEASFLLMLLVRGALRRLSGSSTNTSSKSEYSALALNVLAVAAGSYFTFSEGGTNLTSLGIILAVLAHEWIWKKLSRHKLLLVLESVIALGIILLCFKVEALSNSKNGHHWSFYLGPLYGVLGGGKLLWTVPSQYGFLSILTPAFIAKRYGLSGIDAFSLVVVVLHLATTLLVFFFATSRAKLSPIAAAILASMVCLFFPGWFPNLTGPTSYPSVTGLRFLPAILSVILAEKASRTNSLIWAILAAIVAAIATAWSFESCAYTLLPLCVYAAVRVFFDLSPKFVVTISSLMPILAVCGASVIVVLYALVQETPVDIRGFYEYALRYADGFGTIPIEFSGLTVFYAFTMGFTYFFARSSLRFRSPDAASGAIFFPFLWIVSTYYVARSHPNNVLNIVPWAALAMIGCAPRDQSSQIARLHRVSIAALYVLLLNYFVVSFQGLHPEIKNTFYTRLSARPIWSKLELPAVSTDVVSFVNAHNNTTVVNVNEMMTPGETFAHSGNSVGISPMLHFLVVPGRHCEYLHRMIRERGRLYFLVSPEQRKDLTSFFDSCQNVYVVQEMPQVGTWSAFQMYGR